MRYLWFTVTLITVWLSATLLLVINQAPNAELIFGSAIVATIVLACLGFLFS